MLTEDTCVTEPVDTAQRERVVRAAGRGAEAEAQTKALPLRWLEEQGQGGERVQGTFSRAGATLGGEGGSGAIGPGSVLLGGWQGEDGQ